MRRVTAAAWRRFAVSCLIQNCVESLFGSTKKPGFRSSGQFFSSSFGILKIFTQQCNSRDYRERFKNVPH